MQRPRSVCRRHRRHPRSSGRRRTGKAHSRGAQSRREWYRLPLYNRSGGKRASHPREWCEIHSPTTHRRSSPAPPARSRHRRPQSRAHPPRSGSGLARRSPGRCSRPSYRSRGPSRSWNPCPHRRRSATARGCRQGRNVHSLVEASSGSPARTGHALLRRKYVELLPRIGQVRDVTRPPDWGDFRAERMTFTQRHPGHRLATGWSQRRKQDRNNNCRAVRQGHHLASRSAHSLDRTSIASRGVGPSRYPCATPRNSKSDVVRITSRYAASAGKAKCSPAATNPECWGD